MCAISLDIGRAEILRDFIEHFTKLRKLNLLFKYLSQIRRKVIYLVRKHFVNDSIRLTNAIETLCSICKLTKVVHFIATLFMSSV